MSILAEGNITLTAVNDASSVLLTPGSCMIKADYDGSNPVLTNAYGDISLIRGENKVSLAGATVTVQSTSDPGITAQILNIDAYTKRVKITALATTILSGNIVVSVVTASLSATVTFQFSVIREATMLDWIQDWETNKTSISGGYILTPKIYAGAIDSEGKLTGVYMGPDTNGAGLYGYRGGDEVFHLNATGAMLGGWNLNTGGISSSDGKMKILSEGTIAAYDANDNVVWGLYKTGAASFAKGNVLFNADGSASFTGSITSESGTIGGWGITSRALWKNHVMLDASRNYIGISKTAISAANAADSNYANRDTVHSGGGVCMFYTSDNGYGLEGYLSSGTAIFQLGSTNQIANWTLKANSLASDYVVLSNLGTNAGIFLSTSSMASSALTGLATTIQGGTGIYIQATSSAVEMAGYVSGSLVFKIGSVANVIAGWNFDTSTIWGGVKTVTSDYTTTNTSIVLSTSGLFGYKWCLKPDGTAKFAGGKAVFNADGSGSLADGKISWVHNSGVFQVSIDGVLATDTVNVSGTMTSCLVLSKTIMVQNSNSVVNAGMSAEGTDASAIRFWAGATYANRDSAIFRVTQSGVLYATNAEISGTIRADYGRIAGWKISGSTIINQDDDGNWNSDAAIIFRDDPNNVFVAIGTSVLPSSVATTALARFQNEQVHDLGLGTAINYGVIFSVKGASYNLAITGSGSQSLDGYIIGYGVQTQLCNAANTVYDLKPTMGDLIIIKATVDTAICMLPRLNDIKRMLGLPQNSTTPFHLSIRLILTRESGYHSIPIYPRNTTFRTNNSTTEDTLHPWGNVQYPYLLKKYANEYGIQEELSSEPFVLSQLEPIEIELIYDGTNYWAIKHQEYIAPYVAPNYTD